MASFPIRNVVERHDIANTQALKFTMQMVFNNPARQLSVRKIADYLKGQQLTASREYIADYLDWLSDAYLLHKVGLHSLRIRDETARQSR